MCTPKRTLVERFAVRQSPPKTELPANASVRGAKNKYEQPPRNPDRNFHRPSRGSRHASYHILLDPDTAINLDKISIADVCSGSRSKTEVAALRRDVCFAPRTGIVRLFRHVRKVPIADSCTAAKRVGARERCLFGQPRL